MEKEILVSVLMTAYNQDAFIEKGIESIVRQKCPFSFELIIGEDCSTDKTREIVQFYHEKYPDIVKPIFREKNIGARENSTEVIRAAKGKYIAFCEGDDYWIDDEKLAKQVAYMTTNDYAGVFSRVQYVDRHNESLGYSEDVDEGLLPISYEYLLQKNPVHTCSFMIKKSVLHEIEDIMIKAPYSDFVMFVASSFFGKLGFLQDITAVYRKNVGIMHTWTNANAQLMRIEILDLFNHDPRFIKMRKTLNIAKRFHYYKLTIYKVKERQFGEAFKCYVKTLYYSIFVLLADKEEVCHKVSFKDYIKLSISVIPFAESIYRKVKRID